MDSDEGDSVKESKLISRIASCHVCPFHSRCSSEGDVKDEDDDEKQD